METVDILGLKVKIVPEGDIFIGCDGCVLAGDEERCLKHMIILGRDCYLDSFYFEAVEEE